MKGKLKIEQLRINSFVTNLEGQIQETVKGGRETDNFVKCFTQTDAGPLGESIA